MASQEFVIRTADPRKFVDEVVALAQKGAVLKENTYPRLKGYPITATMVIEDSGNGVDKSSSPNVQAMPVKSEDKTYSKEELESMEWDELKKAAKSLGITGRDRDILTRKYLEAMEEKAKD
jgi:hypothetical protein